MIMTYRSLGVFVMILIDFDTIHSENNLIHAAFPIKIARHRRILRILTVFWDSFSLPKVGQGPLCTPKIDIIWGGVAGHPSM